jgi:quinolinate synthase
MSQTCILPQDYFGTDRTELHKRIQAAKLELGSRLVILGHHYQRDDVIRYADFIGDSFRLCRQAAQRAEADFIVFCGVHFMAESADVLSAPHQTVVLPDLAAGCSMADMAEIDQLEQAWEELEAVFAGPPPVVPITYMNSSAAIKAFCGERGGAVCTSSNAKAVFSWAFERKEKILFLPDQHLGRNTGYGMGIPLDRMLRVGSLSVFRRESA